MKELAMTPELYWMTATAVLTALLWMPYVLNLMAERRLMGALRNPSGEPMQAAWARRAKAAHTNAVENLAVFAPLAIAVSVLGVGTAATATASLVYFCARAAHYVIYTAGVPVLRTLTFTVGLVCQLVLAAALLGGA